MCAQLHVFAVHTILSFWMGLRKVSTKMCAQLHVFSLWRLTWVFDGTWKNVHKKVCPVICFFAVETNLSFWWDLEKCSQKSVPSHTFFRCGDCLKFWIGLRKVSTKMCAQLHVFSLWRLTWVFGGTCKKILQKSVPSHTFFRCGDYLKFLRGLGKFRQKGVTSYTFFSQCRLTWVFDGTWKNFHKKVCPVICFFAVETNLTFWWDLEKFSQKSVPSHTFIRCGDLKFLRGLGKFRQKGLTSYTFFFAVQTILSFRWDLEKFSQKSVPSYTFWSLWRLS